MELFHVIEHHTNTTKSMEHINHEFVPRGLKINLRKSDHALYKVVVGLHKLVLMRGIPCVGYEDIIGSM